MSPVYLVLSTNAIGGAEKRMAGLWKYLREQGQLDVRLVIPRSLEQTLAQTHEFEEPLRRHREGVVTFDDERGRWALPSLLRSLHARDRSAAFHFVLDSPAITQFFLSHRTLFSLPQSSLTQMNRVGRAVAYAGVLRAARIDVLDPRVYQRLRRRFFYKRGAFRLTPNSYVDLDAYQPAPKTNLLAFCGIFTDEKQAFRLLDAVPEVDARLEQAGIRDREWAFMGKDVPPGDLVARARQLAARVNVRAWFEPNPQTVLSRSKVFFSLQRSNNYPSKSLLEALACGNLPIVTDVGDSRRIAPDSVSYYVPRDFSADDIATQALRILTLPEEERLAKVSAARAMLAADYSLASMASYYTGIYRELLR